MFSYEKFETLMRDKGVTAYRVSKETGVPTSALTAWKQGLYVPKVDKIQKLANYFEVSLEELFEDKEDQ